MPMVYMTANRMTTLIQEAVKNMCFKISAKDLSKYSAHLLQVLACVLLDKSGKSPDYICKQLFWLGDSFCMYLCNKRVIQDEHCECLHKHQHWRYCTSLKLSTQT
jgi:hypothetical protein